MAPTIYIIFAAVFASAFLVVLWIIMRAYTMLSGIMLVTCPETNALAAVELDARRAALAAILGRRTLQLKNCRRWRERGPCGEECLPQIEPAPEDCLVRTILMRWYKEKSCHFCGEAFGEINWLDHKPALMSPGRVTLEWNEIPAEKVPETMLTHRPVCWNCHIAETFRRRYPDLVVDRPWRPGESHRLS